MKNNDDDAANQNQNSPSNKKFFVGENGIQIFQKYFPADPSSNLDKKDSQSLKNQNFKEIIKQENLKFRN